MAIIILNIGIMNPMHKPSYILFILFPTNLQLNLDKNPVVGSVTLPISP